jgi:hypothetical protein
MYVRPANPRSIAGLGIGVRLTDAVPAEFITAWG